MQGEVTVNTPFDGVVVTNPYNYYIYFPDAMQWIPPQWFNFVFQWAPSPLGTVRWDTTKDPFGNKQFQSPNQPATFICSNTLSDYTGGGSFSLQIPSNYLPFSGIAPAGGAPLTIIPPVTGAVVYLYDLLCTQEESGRMELQRTDNSLILAHNLAIGIPLTFPFKGKALPAGVGVQYVNTTGGNIAVDGIITFNQYS